MTQPDNDLRDAVARVGLLETFPGLKDRIIAAFGKAAWINQGGISVHGSDDGGRLAMNHSGWAALPALLNEALSPVAADLGRVTAEREAIRRERLPHMCRDDHPEIRHAVSDDELCPVCRERDRAETIQATLDAEMEIQAEVRASLAAAEAEATRLHALLVERDEAARRAHLERLREAHSGFAMIHDALAESTRPKQACGELCAHWRDRFGNEIKRHLAALDKALTPKEPA